jgi:hypothetical protein
VKHLQNEWQKYIIKFSHSKALMASLFIDNQLTGHFEGKFFSGSIPSALLVLMITSLRTLLGPGAKSTVGLTEIFEAIRFCMIRNIWLAQFYKVVNRFF